ncbi:hypothetical protein GW17_00046372 [Ensete ventricosum]|nr:hypothetical protein GW17_00046372 [Ensete ventricosum]
MDLGELRGMPKVTSGKVPPTRPTAREVSGSPAREAPKASSKRPVDAPAEESHSRLKGKEPAAPSEEPETPAGSEEGGASPAHRRPRLMKDLFKTKVHKDDVSYYTLLMSDLGHQDPEKEMKARWKGLQNSTKASEKELHEVQSNLADAQRLLKEARVRARKMDDELL